MFHLSVSQKFLSVIKSSLNDIHNKFFSLKLKPQMEILQFQPASKTIALKKVEIPSPDHDDDVVVKVIYAGVCGTDLHIIAGDFPASDQPIVLGHEISGTVYAIGPGVKHVKFGDNVGVDPQSSCGLCKYCRTAAYHVCPDGALNTTLGIFRDGGWAQFCKVPAKQVYRLPTSISLKQGVLLEPLSCIAHAMTRIYPLAVGSKILVSGAGIIGNIMSCLLYHLGHRSIIIAEPHDGRQDLAKNLFKGLECQVIHPNNLKEVVKDSGIDLCIDCSGNGKAIEAGIELMNPCGKVCIFGCASPETKISVSPFQLFLKELSIFSTTINQFSYNCAVDLMEAMGKKFMDYEKLGVKVFALNQHQEALDTLKKGLISKAVFKLDPQVE